MYCRQLRAHQQTPASEAFLPAAEDRPPQESYILTCVRRGVVVSLSGTHSGQENGVCGGGHNVRTCLVQPVVVVVLVVVLVPAEVGSHCQCHSLTRTQAEPLRRGASGASGRQRVCVACMRLPLREGHVEYLSYARRRGSSGALASAVAGSCPAATTHAPGALGAGERRIRALAALAAAALAAALLPQAERCARVRGG